MKKDLLSIAELSHEEIFELFRVTKALKKDPKARSSALKGKVIGLIFEKPSTRTRVSFEAGAIQLGAGSMYLGSEDIEFGVREPVRDIARVFSRYVDLAVLRTYKHSDIDTFASYADIPVINGLSDFAHPCQALTDIFTAQEKFGEIKGRTIAYVGDGNNVLHSLVMCAAKASMNMHIATPKKYSLTKESVAQALKLARKHGCKINFYNDPKLAVKGADIIYTDVWVSMGQESQAKKKITHFKGFQVNSKLMSLAKKGAFFMHCLPAHRGEETTDEVMESVNSIVFDQAENRLHVAKAIMLKLLK